MLVDELLFMVMVVLDQLGFGVTPDPFHDT
jgi:hypothetical protein